MKLRPHHSLCMQFFEGKGYSEEFTEYMYKLLSLPEETVITITDELDFLCEHCPNHPDGICKSNIKVSKYDKSVMDICNFKVGDSLTIKEFRTKARNRIVDKGLVSNVCGDCEFINICNR